MSFEYDPVKSRTNKTKHGIEFEEAKRLWLDPKLLTIDAKTIDEPRQLAIGKIAGKCWTAVTTPRGRNIRIISVRRSRKSEVKLYEEHED